MLREMSQANVGVVWKPMDFRAAACRRGPQNDLISRFTRMVSAIDRTIDQARHPGMNRTRVRSPDRFQIMNIAHRLHCVGFGFCRDKVGRAPVRPRPGALPWGFSPRPSQSATKRTGVWRSS
jgi:hypothetical protein